ncbi:enoyl-CoA hydratase/isomerase family protein [Phycicoccus sp. BSK3Z-2]|uniref:Enoyl-CoA hydratase/isomerase family protein n=1 Tax=Phycicoccus avicenniae TaxID=2828860 RepID=A0A941DCJ4_9MICO|nr:enoyl-CoA hydratase-related protein [Phycicoccus avicenniae]MBR7744482.1 enoyl-CoA hydratase/isomerase family protein [Phycicoccus avicenniae]
MPVTTTWQDRVAVVTLDRPERRNAVDLATLDELHHHVDAAAPDARALVLTGASGHFCAGADLITLEDVSFTQRLAEILTRLADLPFTTVAAVDGACMGLGMQLALACDVRVVGDDARFAVPVARLGLMVDHWTLDRLARLWGEGAARHMVLTGAVLDADDAWRLGAAQVRGGLPDALGLAARAADLAPLTQSGSKLGLGVPADDDAGVSRYEAAFARAWASADLVEGRAAFAERRPPVFEGA